MKSEKESSAVEQRRSSPYQLFMLGLCVYVLAALAVEVLFDLNPETRIVLQHADTAICFFFLGDFLRSLWKAEKKLRYLYTWGWLDLLSSIPTVPFLRWGRAARIVRILRVLRGLRATRYLSTVLLKQRAQCAFWATLLFALLVVIFGSIAILHLEASPEASIASASDALWWSIVTMTTVGYGDLYPVTGAGRLLAALLMASGILLFGTFTAVAASALLAPGEAEQEKALELLRTELAALRETMEKKEPEGP